MNIINQRLRFNDGKSQTEMETPTIFVRLDFLQCGQISIFIKNANLYTLEKILRHVCDLVLRFEKKKQCVSRLAIQRK